MKRPTCLTNTTTMAVAISIATGVITLGFAAGLLVGCGGGSKAAPDGGQEGDASAATSAEITSCQAYCDTAIASQCTQPLYGSVGECRTAECADLASAPARCQAALKAYYECERTQPNICEDNGCMAEAGAVIDCSNAAAGP